MLPHGVTLTPMPVLVLLLVVTLFSGFVTPQDERAESELQRLYDRLSVSGLDSLLSHEGSPRGEGHCDEDHGCLQGGCMSGAQLLTSYNLSHVGLNVSDIRVISPGIVLQLTTACDAVEKHGNKPSKKQAWGYGLLAVTVINLTSVLGFFFKPCMNTVIYKKIMMYMVSLAVGTLSGSALVFLIPESFVFSESKEYADIYAWKLITVCGGIYMFFLTERLLSMLMKWMDKRNETAMVIQTSSVAPASITFKTETKQDHMITPFEKPEVLDMSYKGDLNDNSSLKNHGHSHGKSIKTVAWMIIIGDAIHNFMDGLAMGAAFNHDITGGVSVSLAVFCEELPHELGDFAVLLNSGMTMKQAICFNFLSACTCYFGFIVGVIIGEIGDAASWVFVLTAGMFLYISLVDMFPEVNAAAEQEVDNGANPWSVFLIQNLGLLTGWGIMLALAKFGHLFEL